MSYLGSMGAVDAEALEAGKKRGIEAVEIYKKDLNNPSAYNPTSEEEAFYRGFVEGYNNELESIWGNEIDASGFYYIGLNDARNMVKYEVQKVEVEQKQESTQAGSSQTDSSGMNVFDWLKMVDPNSNWMNTDSRKNTSEEVKTVATITDTKTGKSETVTTTKKAGFNPMLIAGIAAAALAVYIVFKKD